MLTPQAVESIQRALKDAGLDGWLIYDFRGLNPVASGLLQLGGMGSRRIFVFIPTKGSPTAITHAIEQGPWRDWPSGWDKKVYSGWRVLESELNGLVKGKRIAMEYSPGDAVPYLDRIPAGVLEMVRAAGADIVSSGELVTRFYAVWTNEQLQAHKRAAEIVAKVAHDAGDRVQRADRKNGMTEYELREWIVQQFTDAGLITDHGPIVAIGPNAANPHYEPSATQPQKINHGDILLIDLWAKESEGIFADQTWMFSLGHPTDRDQTIWRAIRDARDAAIKLLRARIESGEPVSGGEVDNACRAVIEERGFGEYFIHRTGHSIDSRELHGSGPHIDDLETRDERLLVPGIGFSIEPGIYIAGDVGMRTEVNAYVGDGELLVTPSHPQEQIIVV